MIPTPDQIPAELRDCPNWVAWKLVPRDPKPAKKPFVSATQPADVTKGPWLDFEHARALAATAGFGGIGFVFTGTPFCGVDLDDVIDATSGALEPWAIELVEKLGSWTERSQSGAGVHVIVRATVADSAPKRSGRLECYSDKRFFALTGDLLFDRPVAAAQATIDGLFVNAPAAIAKAAKPAEATTSSTTILGPPPTALSDADRAIIDRIRATPKDARRFFVLFDEGERDAKRESEAAWDLICVCCRATDDDAAVERILRASALRRPKFDQKRGASTWLAYTIANARKEVRASSLGGEATFRFLGTDELEHEHEPEWLLPDVLPENALAVLYGPSSAGKSFLAIDWALSLARQGKVVAYVAAEGWSGTKRRVRAWQLTHPGSPPPVLWMSGNINLLDPHHVQQFILAAKAELNGKGEHVDLIVLDTLNQNMPGGDENTASDMTAVIGSANTLRLLTGATVLVLHHPRKSDDVERGHSSLRNAADTMLQLKVEDETSQLVLKCTKQKDAAPFEPARRFTLREVVDPDTNLPVSLVVEATTKAEAPLPDLTSSKTPNLRLTLEAVEEQAGQSVARHKDVIAAAVEKGMSEPAAERCLKALHEKYRLVVKGKGGYRLATDDERRLATQIDVAQDDRLEENERQPGVTT